MAHKLARKRIEEAYSCPDCHDFIESQIGKRSNAKPPDEESEHEASIRQKLFERCESGIAIGSLGLPSEREAHAAHGGQFTISGHVIPCENDKPLVKLPSSQVQVEGIDYVVRKERPVTTD